MAQGNALQKIIRDDADRRRLADGLEQAVVRYGCEFLSYVIMGNHLRLLLEVLVRTWADMQSFLSGKDLWTIARSCRCRSWLWSIPRRVTRFLGATG